MDKIYRQDVPQILIRGVTDCRYRSQFSDIPLELLMVHYETFFPLVIECVCRFRSRRLAPLDSCRSQASSMANIRGAAGVKASELAKRLVGMSSCLTSAVARRINLVMVSVGAS